MKETEKNNIVPSAPLPKVAYSPEEVAAMLGICRDSVYRLIRRGKLHCASALRHKIIAHSEVERFLRA